MKRIERIAYYEDLLNESVAALRKYEEALQAFIGIQDRIAELDRYYGSAQWKKDLEASEQGKLPADLPCGVLSEDGIWNLLEDNRSLLEDTAAAVERFGKK